MLRLLMREDGTPVMTQVLSKPSIYLDHNILMDYAASADLADRFISFLRSTNGTLAISWLNLLEFCDVFSAKTRRHVDVFIDRVSPHLFFLEVIPMLVTQKEKELRSGVDPFPPHGGEDLLAVFSNRAHDSPNPYACTGLLDEVPAERYRETTSKLKPVVVNKLMYFKDMHDNDPGIQSIATQITGIADGQPNTEWVFLEIIFSLLKNHGTHIRGNDAVDLHHTVVPLVYCDYLLLDGSWAHIANNAKSRLISNGYNAPLATVFSRRKNGHVRFLESVEDKFMASD